MRTRCAALISLFCVVAWRPCSVDSPARARSGCEQLASGLFGEDFSQFFLSRAPSGVLHFAYICGWQQSIDLMFKALPCRNITCTPSPLANRLEIAVFNCSPTYTILGIKKAHKMISLALFVAFIYVRCDGSVGSKTKFLRTAIFCLLNNEGE